MGESDDVPLRVSRYFLTPCEKWEHGRRPFKLVTQILKILIITTQIYRFGSLTQDTVEFQNDVELAVKNILTDGANVEFISSQDEYYREIYNLRRGLYQLGSSSLANLTNITSIEMAFQPEPLLNYTLTPFTLDEPFAKMINTTQGGISLDLELHVICKMKFSMVLTHLDAQRDGVLDVYNVDYTVVIDNSDHSGLATYTISQFLYTADEERLFSLNFNFTFDVLTLSCTCLSLGLVTRSLYRAQKLRFRFQHWHESKFGHSSSHADNVAFIDGWYIIIFVSDLAIIIGTLLKIDAQSRTFAGLDAFQNSCAFLGVGCLLLYCGILRYLGYFQGYNILVLTISTALPNVLKFLSCALTLYCGYALCGWLVLGPFNDKFRTLTVTSETLFSLLNGDDMFNTFQILEPRGPLLFSQVYLYSFICVFIYVVLSLFISVVMDSYDTIKANNGMRNHPPGVKAALADAVADAQSGRYDRPGADISTCNPCFFLLPRRRFNSTSTSADQSLLGETEINLGEPGETTQVQSSNSTLSTGPY